jgi:thioredoxin-like negative regulator of GroEL
MKFYYFTTGWCKPCKATSPIVAEFAEIEKIDADENEGGRLASKLGVRSVPAVVVVDGNDAIDGLIGKAITKDNLKRLISEHS